MAHHPIWPVFCVMCVAASPVLAQAPDRAAPSAPPPAANAQLNNFSLRNLASKPIEQATAHMTNGATADVTAKGRIMPNQAQPFTANHAACLDSLSVKFAGGRTLEAAHLADCGSGSIIVRDDKIDLSSSASHKMTPPSEPSDR